MVHHSYLIQMEIAGSTAMWTRPDSGDSPVSYPAPTYSACKGIFESILFGPDVEIIPTRVEICAPVQFHSYATNYKGPLRQKKSIDLGNAYQMYSTVLIDVCYRLYAVVVPNHRKDTLSEKTLKWDRRTTSPGHAYQEIFNRRLQRGQCFAIPSLGLREFTASYFGPFRDGTKVCTDMEDIHIPSTLRQVFPDGHKSKVSYRFDNDVTIHAGTLVFPPKRGVHFDQ